jgi:cyclopropane-fatty-acyl-phospholipid synthase
MPSIMQSGLPSSHTAQATDLAERELPIRNPAQGSESIPPTGRLLLALLGRLRTGRITLVTPAGQTLEFGSGGPAARIRLANWKVAAASLRRGDIGFAESWIAQDWHTDDLPALLKVIAANRDAMQDAIYGRGWRQLIDRIKHLLNRNSRAGSRRNIHAHYDLGNPFYSVWLDPSMTYSSALFGASPAQSLEAAQTAKYRRILDVLALPRGARVLEIGCGWGGFAELAARDGLQVTGLTLSTEQLEWARQRMDAAQLSEHTQLKLQDYRDEHDRYDAIVSIEMFEAVGERYWPDYFATLRRCLAPGAQAVIQTITIDERLFDRYRSGTDFIQQYIFPGGMLPSPSAFESQSQAAGLTVTDRFRFGPDYARTLALWRDGFLAGLPTITAQGFDARFARIWEFYLAYCEAGFDQGNIDVIQYTLRAPG